MAFKARQDEVGYWDADPSGKFCIEGRTSLSEGRRTATAKQNDMHNATAVAEVVARWNRTTASRGPHRHDQAQHLTACLMRGTLRAWTKESSAAPQAHRSGRESTNSEEEARTAAREAVRL